MRNRTGGSRSPVLLGLTVMALMGCAHNEGPEAPPEILVRSTPQLLAETAVPSVSVAKVEHGRVAWVATWGDQSVGRPASPDTLYNVASLTKPIVAETVLRAAQRDRVDLDESMAPWWSDPDLASDPRRLALTPRLALTHRTGFANWRRETGGRLGFQNAPGQAVGYSGEGFEYLARYAERRFEMPFERLAEVHVFGPAGMRSTSFTGKPWFEGRLAVPTDDGGRSLVPSVGQTFNAADDLYTTAGDYGRFLVGVASRTGLSRDLARERDSVVVEASRAPYPGAPTCPDRSGWGLGWEVTVFGPDNILWHTGADRGEFTFAYIIPRTGEGAVILTNSALGHRVIVPILSQIGTHPAFLAHLRAEVGT